MKYGGNRGNLFDPHPELIEGLLFKYNLDKKQKIKDNKNNMKSITLSEAVAETLNEFKSQGKEFSIYDITTQVREKVNNQEFRITDVDIVVDADSPTGTTYNISHSAVKDIFLSLDSLENGDIEEMEFNGQYRTYKFDNVQVNKPPITGIVENLDMKDSYDSMGLVTPKSKTGDFNIEKVVSKLKIKVGRQKYCVLFDNKLFSTPQGKVLFARKSDASAAFNKAYFGNVYHRSELKKVLESLGYPSEYSDWKKAKKEISVFLKTNGKLFIQEMSEEVDYEFNSP